MIAAVILLLAVTADSPDLPTSEWVASTESFREAVEKGVSDDHLGVVASLYETTVSDLDCRWRAEEIARCSYRFRVSDGAGVVRDWTDQTSEFRRVGEGEWSFSRSRETNIERGRE